MKKPNKRSVGRPVTGRALARYWLKKETVKEIKRRKIIHKMKRPADYLEYLLANTM